MNTTTRKNLIFFALVTVMLTFTGCGGGSNGDDESNEGAEGSHLETPGDDGSMATGNGGGTQTTPTNNGNTGGISGTAVSFANNVMPILNAECKGCHGSNGRFTITDTQGTYANISDLQGTMTQAAQYLLNKATATISHGGGQVIDPGSAEYTTIKAWVDAGAPNN